MGGSPILAALGAGLFIAIGGLAFRWLAIRDQQRSPAPKNSPQSDRPPT